MPRYKFDWSNLPVGLLVKLARSFDLEGADLSLALRGAFGARPREDFVREARPVLEEAWLAHDPEALAQVVHALWRPSRDGYVVPVDVREQLEWLAERNTTEHLCRAVLAELVKAGEHPPPLFHVPREPKVVSRPPANEDGEHQVEKGGSGPGRQPVLAPALQVPAPGDRDPYRPRPTVKTTGSPVGSPPALEVGQLVRARGQQWVVSALRRSSQPEDELAPARLPGRTLATLTSVSDDDLGEELTVVWEVEPGREVLPVSDLPDAGSPPYDDPEVLGAFLDAVRWGTVASADTRTLQAPFRSGIRVEDYQLEPVARALAMPRVNLLIADDVGLGKTIEAGLIAQELLLRHRARRMIVVCPASLTNKWHEEMRDRFGLEFQVLDAGALKELRRSHGLEANPFSVFPRTIISLQWLRMPRAQRLLDEVLGPGTEYPGFFDLLIVDEAHHCAPPAPARARGYAVDSKQTQAVARLGAHSTHRLFLSATPHNGYPESWQALLVMVDPQRFQRGAKPDPSAVDQVVVRRLKASVTDAEGRPRFPARVARAIEVAYTEDERRAHDLLERYAAARRRQLQSGDGKARSKASDLVTLLLKKRLFSSPAAFAATLEAHIETLERPSGGRVAAAQADEESAEQMGLSWRSPRSRALRGDRRPRPRPRHFACEQRRPARSRPDWAGLRSQVCCLRPPRLRQPRSPLLRRAFRLGRALHLDTRCRYQLFAFGRVPHLPPPRAHTGARGAGPYPRRRAPAAHARPRLGAHDHLQPRPRPRGHRPCHRAPPPDPRRHRPRRPRRLRLARPRPPGRALPNQDRHPLDREPRSPLRAPRPPPRRKPPAPFQRERRVMTIQGGGRGD